jgi:hypothetical protein
MGGRDGPGLGPFPLIPLAYLLCAAVAFLVATAGVVWLAPEMAGHYYHPRLIALTHTVTLGWITIAIMGASYQIVPIVLERPLWSARLARWQLVLLVTAVSGMVAHFYLGTWPGLTAAAGLLAVGVVLHLLNIGLSMRGVERWTFTALLLALGHGGLAATTLFGLGLAVYHLRPILPADLFATLHAHVQLALLGWVAPMILGVAARVYPMFLRGPLPGRPARIAQVVGLGLGVPSVVVGLMAARWLLPLGAVAVSLAALSHAGWVLRTTRHRKRSRLGWGLRFALTGTVFITLAIVLGVALATDQLSGPRAALAYAVAILGGWVSLTIVGMMLEIVPFLVWYKAYASRAGREPVPALAALGSPRLEAFMYACLVGGMALLVGAAFVGEVAWIRTAGCLLLAGGLAFLAALCRMVRHLDPSRADIAGSMTAVIPRQP